jgi:hypothetical protein
VQEVTIFPLDLLVPSQLAAVLNCDCPDRDVLALGLPVLSLLADVVTVDDSAENRVLLVQVRRILKTNEELTAVGVRARICHRQDTLVSVGVPYLLVIEFLTVD